MSTQRPAEPSDEFVRLDGLLPLFLADLARRADAAGDAGMAERIGRMIEWYRLRDQLEGLDTEEVA